MSFGPRLVLPYLAKLLRCSVFIKRNTRPLVPVTMTVRFQVNHSASLGDNKAYTWKNWYRHSSEYFMLCEPSALQYNIYAALKMERLRSTFYLFCRSEIHLKSTGSYWDVWCFSENPNEFRRETFKILIWDWFYSKQLIVGIINYRMQTPCIHNKGKGIWFESKQPFVGKSVVWWHLKQIGLNLVLDPWLI